MRDACARGATAAMDGVIFMPSRRRARRGRTRAGASSSSSSTSSRAAIAGSIGHLVARARGRGWVPGHHWSMDHRRVVEILREVDWMDGWMDESSNDDAAFLDD